MAKKIDIEMAQLFVAQRRFAASNTTIVVNEKSTPGYVPTVINMVLYGTKIASWCPELASFWTSLAGFNTATTRSRLNALIYAMFQKGVILNPNIYANKKGQAYWGLRPVTDLKSLQWHALPPANRTHPGCAPYQPDVSVPVPEPLYQLSYEKNMEVLIG